MKFLLLFFLCIPAFSDDVVQPIYEVTPLSEASATERDILGGRLAKRTERALERVLMVAAGELLKRGHRDEAKLLKDEWDQTYQFTFRAFASDMSSRDIGDHAPLSQWLADKYNTIEMLLGVDVCKATHISDIKTFNHTIPIVFRPCSFPMDAVLGDRIDEYRNHFSEGNVYYGLVPVTTYWVTYAAITFGTMGSGFMFVSGIGASIAERAIAMVTPKLSDTLYKRICE